MREPCAICNHDVSRDKYIVAIFGRLYCSRCASMWFTSEELAQYSEIVTPQDIGLNRRVKDALTLEQVLQNMSDDTLIEMYVTLKRGIVPTTSTVRKVCRKINELIDKGEIRIGPNYRKVYLPTLAKAINEELARRYVYKILMEESEHDTDDFYSNLQGTPRTILQS